MDKEPKCPKCGAKMKIKTARSGPYIGKQFYGCSTYPACKGIINIDSQEVQQVETGDDSEQYQLTREFHAREFYKNYEVSFFQSVAATESVVESLLRKKNNANYKNYFSQWRLDYPSPEEHDTPNDKYENILALIEKILCRGTITLLSKKTEDELHNIFSVDKDTLTDFEFTDKFSLLLSGMARDEIEFDSNEEGQFYELLARAIPGGEISKWVIPQASLLSLIENNSDEVLQKGYRVDFLFHHPSLTSPKIFEVDGEQHKESKTEDEHRDKKLKEKGFDVHRFSAKKIREAPDSVIAEIKKILEPIIAFTKKKNPDNKGDQLIVAGRLIHQIQLTILRAMIVNQLRLDNQPSWKIFCDLKELDIFKKEQAELVVKLAINDFIELLDNTQKLYDAGLVIKEIDSVDLLLDNNIDSINIMFSSTYSGSKNYYISEFNLPFNISFHSLAISGTRFPIPDYKNLQYFLNYIFHKEDFWEGQVEAITRAFQGKDTVVLLPTGAGKSIAFQLASILLPGRAIIIEPIIALMNDQIDNLKSYGIDRVTAITSEIKSPEVKKKIINRFGHGDYLFAYMSPERLQSANFRESLSGLTTHTSISVIVIDEAHCVSEWSHDFRTAYLNSGRTARQYCKKDDHTPPILALTGTASLSVLKDVQRELVIDFESIITPKSFGRDELNFGIIIAPSSEKRSKLFKLISELLPKKFKKTQHRLLQPKGKETFSGLVFSMTVNGKYGVKQIADELKTKTGQECLIYSTTAPDGEDKRNWPKKKNESAYRFTSNQVSLMACTKAFGMGIDKPNIRYTIHYGLPASIESFYQEAGRAGRDRRKSYCYIILSNDNKEKNNELLNPATDIKKISDFVDSSMPNDDIKRLFYFHDIAFSGIESELDVVKKIIMEIGDLTKEQDITIMADGNPDAKEKAIHRLTIIGFLSDYTVKHGKMVSFQIRTTGAEKTELIKSYCDYVSTYLESRAKIEKDKAEKLNDLTYENFIVELTRLLITFIYEVIENQRRRAINEMLQIAEGETDSESIKRRILDYLETNEFKKDFDKILEDNKDDMEAAFEVAKKIIEANKTPRNSAKLRGQTARTLTDDPDQPILLFMRAMSEVFSNEQDIDVIKQNYDAFIDNIGKSVEDENRVHRMISWGLNKTCSVDGDSVFIDLYKEVTRIRRSGKTSNRNLLRLLVTDLPEEEAVLPTWDLISNLNSRASRII